MMKRLTNNSLSIKVKSGLKQNINALTTTAVAVEGELHYATDSKELFIFDGTKNFKVSGPSSVVPSSSSDTGVAGDVAYDGDYLYVCVATDTWKRVALNTW